MKKIGSIMLVLFTCITVTAQVQVNRLKVENLTNPFDIDRLQSLLSWQLTSGNRNVMQTAYEVRASNNATFKGAAA